MFKPAGRFHRLAIAFVSTFLAASTASAQIPDQSVEALQFAYVAPAKPQVTLEAWDGSAVIDKGFIYTVGPVAVAWDRIDLDWRFRWQSVGPTVASVRWELSKYPFPSSGDFVPLPGSGLVGHESAAIILVDLNLLAPRPPNWTPKLAFQGITGAFKSIGIPPPPTEITPGNRPTRLDALNIRFAGAMIPDPSNASVQAYMAQADPVIAQSMSLYARVVPLDPAGVVMGPPSNVVKFEFFAPDSNVITPPLFVHPTATFAGYTPVRPYSFDWGCHVVYTMDIEFLGIKKGDKANACDDDSDIVGDILDALGDVFQFMADFVNWVSDAYSAIKNEVASQMSSALTTFGVPCNQTCAAIALNVALTAAGMPPELPDVEALQAMGEGYLVDAVADYAEANIGVAVPPEAREELRKQLHKMIDDAAANVSTGGEGSQLYIPDVAYQYHGPIVVIDLSNPSQYWSMAAPLRVDDLTGRYQGRTFFVPPIGPGQSFRIALTLDPIQDPRAWMDLMPTKDDLIFSVEYWEKYEAGRTALRDWTTTYQTGDLVLKVTVGPYDAFTAILPAKN
jgi:hypothetical protein